MNINDLWRNDKMGNTSVVIEAYNISEKSIIVMQNKRKRDDVILEATPMTHHGNRYIQLRQLHHLRKKHQINILFAG